MNLTSLNMMSQMRPYVALVASSIFFWSMLLPLEEAEAHAARSRLNTNTYVWFSVGSESIDGIYSIAYGDVPSLELRRSVDRDGDGIISSEEHLAFVRELRELLGECFALVHDDSPLEVRWRDDPIELENSAVVPEWVRIDAHFTSSFDMGREGLVEITDSCVFPSRGESEYRLEPALGVIVDHVEPDAEQEDGVYVLGFTRAPPPLVRFRFDAGAATEIGIREPPEPDSVRDLPEAPPDRLTELLRQSQALTFWALLVAFGLGALHALSPGHGKTLVAAYLVGERGTVWQAILLGSVVTVTHVSSVVAVGLLALLASEYFLPDSISRLLTVFSGLLILLIGAFMLRTRWKEKLAHLQGHQHHGGHHHHHSHDEEHEHDHPHEHEGHVHPAPGVSLWRLLTLGISGGLVPCPSAMVVLLLAIAVGRVTEGMLLIAAFSLGLACILVSIGILVVRAERLLNRLMPSRRRLAWLPVVSACVVTVIGAAIVIDGLLGL